MEDLHASWHRAWRGVGARGEGGPLRDALIARYDEPHRAYHTVQHLRECLGWLDRVGLLADHPAEVELALWFHDAVYDVRRHDNEERSADLARDSLAAVGVDDAVAARVAALVLATRHSAAPSGRDEQVLVDIDLSILGAEPARFAEYDRQIREEYAFVPADTYKLKRREVLQSFLDRPRLYLTEPMHAALEEPARRNLRRAVRRAEGRRIPPPVRCTPIRSP
jgi:predicted metal-dependent HD superfamily phosphohydrolase